MSHAFDSDQPILSLDRRTRVRHAVSPETECVANAGDDQGASALILDISTGGLSLVLHRNFEMGTRLVCDIGKQRLSMHVVHVRQEGDCYIHGCEFERPLAPSDVERML